MVQQKQAFTLIELLVVVLIIGILAAVAVPQYRKAVIKSRYVQLMISADAIAKAEEVLYLANGAYTSNLYQLDISVPDDGYEIYVDTSSNEGVGIVVAQDRSDLGMGYNIYLQHGVTRPGRECRVYKDEPYIHQICKSLTGKQKGDNGGSYWEYRFD
ncbi:MAG: prepilin-type N-terminal cleavage/methylation domain-containing protein [Elusimicrobiaceae bacterium]|nr:prepilin-type N-terminal cleavage/methylation domain-containing protein [Elusimicrobiaceae bacterium]